MRRAHGREAEYPNRAEPPTPIGDRRLSGAHWWDPDRIRHLEDLPGFCPRCGAAIVESGGLAVEYWEGDQRIYHTWCPGCGWAGDITKVERIIGHEAER